jgi:hypothetical protein
MKIKREEMASSVVEIADVPPGSVYMYASEDHQARALYIRTNSMDFSQGGMTNVRLATGAIGWDNRTAKVIVLPNAVLLPLGEQ